MLKLATVPWLLVGLRFLIAPLLLLDALDGTTGVGFIIGYTIAVLSDILMALLPVNWEAAPSNYDRQIAGQILACIFALQFVPDLSTPRF